jgi:hypothetical protein
MFDQNLFCRAHRAADIFRMAGHMLGQRLGLVLASGTI